MIIESPLGSEASVEEKMKERLSAAQSNRRDKRARIFSFDNDRIKGCKSDSS
jgi:hypothetical protein